MGSPLIRFSNSLSYFKCLKYWILFTRIRYSLHWITLLRSLYLLHYIIHTIIGLVYSASLYPVRFFFKLGGILFMVPWWVWVHCLFCFPIYSQGLMLFNVLV